MMRRALGAGIDRYRIWYKITFQRGRILATPPEAWRRYADPPPFPDARRFFPSDGRIPDVRRVEEVAPRGVRIERLEFDSLHPIPLPESNRAVGRFYRPAERPDAPFVVLCHGWAHRKRRGIEHLYVRPFLRHGWAVLMLSHPLHFERTPAGVYSGELMVSGDAALTVEAFRQAVVDLGAAVNFLLAEGARPWGIFGYSLGGYIAGLLGCVRSDPSFLVLAGCGDSLLSPILDTPLGRNVREDLQRTGLGERPRLEGFWSTISPSRWRPAVPRERILLVAGRHDRIMLAESVERLWEAWGRPALRWLPRGHYTLLAAPGALMRASLPFMQERLPRGETEKKGAAPGGGAAPPSGIEGVPDSSGNKA